MADKNLVRGLFLSGIALAFGLPSLQYKVGTFSRAGPGMFPLIVSSLLLTAGLIMVLRARFVARDPMGLNLRNIGIVMASLCGFALLSLYLDMIVGITFLVFCSAFAGATYSVSRNIKISLGLVAVAFAFQQLLGLNLPLL